LQLVKIAAVTVWRVTFVAASMLAITSSSETVDSIDVTPEQAKQWAISTPKPTYPISARRRIVTGSGFFELLVEVKTGLVKMVKTLRTTGDPDLDYAAKATLQQWRFKPGVLPPVRKNNPYCQMRVPIIFSLTGIRH
jgi:TonB family protein